MTNRTGTAAALLSVLAIVAALAGSCSSDPAGVATSATSSTMLATPTSAAATAPSVAVAPTDGPSTTSEPTAAASTTTASIPATSTPAASTTAASTTAAGSAAPSPPSGAPQPGPNVYLAFSDTGNVTARSGDRVLGEAECGECSVSAATYRDGTIWMAEYSDVAEVTRHDLAAGTTSSVYRAEPGTEIRDLAVWDSSVWIVTRSDGTAATGPSTALVAVDATGIRQIEANVVGVAASADGRYLAYATCALCTPNGQNRPGTTGRTVVVVADLISGERREITAGGSSDGYFLVPKPLQWTADGMLLLDDTWEGNRTALLAFSAVDQAAAVPLTGGLPTSGRRPVAAEAACFVDAGHVAVARWFHPYAEGDPTPGPIVVRSIVSPDETTYGSASVIGTSMACDTNGAVVVATDDGRLVRITPAGTTTELGIGYARVSAA